VALVEAEEDKARANERRLEAYIETLRQRQDVARGNGDQFAFLSPPVDRDDVFAWDHEDDSRQWFAADLRHYLEGWITGRLSV